ncbi:unnamed protein product [Amoebophrya sp. A25]|nr:unnamed protein product [Amoebophrya sp. A25]|eukprot:GSA25T00023337001.1
MQLQGCITALVTPFTEDDEVDYESLEALVEKQIAEGVDGLLPVGTTGESPTLSHEEHEAVIEFVVKTVNHRVPVIAGAGSNSTIEAVRLTKHAKAVGADAVLSVNPYYNKPTQEGLMQHFAEVAKVGIPIVLYNIPGRTNISMTPETVEALHARFPEQIVAIKEASGSLDQASEIAARCPAVTILSGDDSITLPLMSIGAQGVISVLANMYPKLVKDVTESALTGDWETARISHVRNFLLYKSLFCEPNPCPVKLGMAKLGMIKTARVRLPLVESDPVTVWQGKVKPALDKVAAETTLHAHEPEAGESTDVKLLKESSSSSSTAVGSSSSAASSSADEKA